MSEDRMKMFLKWVHDSVKGDSLDVVKITDFNKTVLGLKDTKSDEVFILGSLHNLTFILNCNEYKG